MTKKNWGLLLIFLLLSGVFGILVSQQAAITSLEVEEDLFAVEDTTSIERVELQLPQGNTQVLERSGRGWQLNNTYEADPQLMQLMLSVLSNVEVKRPVARSQQEEIVEGLRQQGVQVRIYKEGGAVQEFIAGGDQERGISYFLQEGEAYVVELPGYSSYVSGIFNLTENNLRDRTIFQTNYLNLRELTLAYPGDAEDIHIRFDRNRLEVENISQPDSAQLLGFLSLFENLQATGFVNVKEYPELDSLLRQQPVARIEVTNIQHPEEKVLEIYQPTRDGRYRLAYLPEEQQALLLDERLAQLLLLTPEELRKE